MGTSVSQSSRASTNWFAVHAAYRSELFPVEQVVREVWRAAQIESDRDWREMLSAPIVAECLNITLASDSVVQALNAANRQIALREEGSLAAELAKRAIVQSFSSGNRAQVFSQAVFIEATDYLVSRDLSGHVGPAWRNRTVQDLLAFKDLIRNRVTDVMKRTDLSESAQPQNWTGHVNRALRELSGVEQ